MALLRSINNATDIAVEGRTLRLAGLTRHDHDLTGHDHRARTLRITQSHHAIEREERELQAIVDRRPVGAEVPRYEPKSIDDPVPPSRIRWEPPRKRYEAPKPRKPAF